MAAVERIRCSECGRRRPAESTALVFGRTRGNYRRAGHGCVRRVCAVCTWRRVAFVRSTQQGGRNVPLDTHALAWGRAADAFGYDTSDLYRRTRSRRPGDKAGG